MMAAYIQKKKSCPSESSTPSSPSPMATNYLHNNNNNVAQQNGLNNANGTVNGQNPSETPSPGLNNNNAPKYGTPVPNRIFVGGISAQTTESELAQLFSSYGNVKGTKIIVDRAGVSKGYGFVTFETEMEARRIMRDAQCVVFKQRKLNIAPAIKKQPFSRSLEVQSPPIGIPSTVLYANGSPYMFHNGMAFFSPPETSTNYPPAAATPATSQIATVPAPAAAVCPTMMYPCPPGQPIYQYPYQHVPGHIFRGAPTPMGYIMTPTHVVNHEATAPPSHQHLYYMDGQYVQLCDTPSDLPVGSYLVPTFPVARPAVEVDEGGDRDRHEGTSGIEPGNTQTSASALPHTPVLLLDIGRDAPAAKIPRAH